MEIYTNAVIVMSLIIIVSSTIGLICAVVEKRKEGESFRRTRRMMKSHEKERRKTVKMLDNAVREGKLKKLF